VPLFPRELFRIDAAFKLVQSSRATD
jgi:hypothetical protein